MLSFRTCLTTVKRLPWWFWVTLQGHCLKFQGIGRIQGLEEPFPALNIFENDAPNFPGVPVVRAVFCCSSPVRKYDGTVCLILFYSHEARTQLLSRNPVKRMACNGSPLSDVSGSAEEYDFLDWHHPFSTCTHTTSLTRLEKAKRYYYYFLKRVSYNLEWSPIPLST